ncbi:MAG: DUF5681 domain-containing protein [Acidobacteria bacterium]|nr:DUF5681 domain-containing protein [Acidobacteriota bacterium]
MRQANTTAVKQRTEQRKPPLGRRFQKGRSGNPKGRPPNGQSITALLRAEIEKVSPDDKDGKTWAELIVLATMRLAMAGNSTALKEVWERMDGKVTSELDDVVDIHVHFGADDYLLL